MLSRLAGFVLARRRYVLVGAAVFFVVSLVLGGNVIEHLRVGDWSADGAESTRASHVLQDEFRTGPPDYVLLVSARSGRTVDDPAVAARGKELTKELGAQPGVVEATSYWSLGSLPVLRSRSGTRALVFAHLDGNDDAVYRTAQRLTPKFREVDSLVSVAPSGRVEVVREINEVTAQDLTRAELIAVPLILLLLLLIFRTVVAALMPIMIGALVVVGTFLVLRVLAAMTDVSDLAVNLTSALGFGLSVDYSLLIVSRFREELRGGRTPADAVRITVTTAGRTVAFSALTVAAALAAMLVFPMAPLRSFAYAGVAVAVIGALSSLVVLPAMLGVLGRRIDRLAIWRRAAPEDERGLWGRLAAQVIRRPLTVLGAGAVLLLLLGSPILHLKLGLPDDRALPPGHEGRVVPDIFRQEFSANETSALQVVAPDVRPSSRRDAQVSAYAARLSALPGVARVDAATGSYGEGRRLSGRLAFHERFARPGGTWLSVVPKVESYSSGGERLVHELRTTPSPFRVLVSGDAAHLVDTKDALVRSLPVALALVVVVSLILLWWMFQSVLIPLKAVVLNVLSLSAMFGAMVWVFQDGHLSHTLDFTATGSIAAPIPILMFCIAFGLSMDYQVFLLSRIREEYDRSGDNAAAIVSGLARSGRILTTAAIVVSVVCLATATSRVSYIKLFGIGLALAVLIDAFVIRGTIVPALMKLAGRANWWSPRLGRRARQSQDVIDLRPPVAMTDEGGPSSVEHSRSR